MAQRSAFGGAMTHLLALTIIAIAAPTAAGVDGEVKCGGCFPCGSGCPVVYPSPPPPPPNYYYSPPPPSYPGVLYCPPPPAGYIEVAGTPLAKGLYPQDPGFMPSGAPRHLSRAVPFTVCAFAALASLWVFW